MKKLIAISIVFLAVVIVGVWLYIKKEQVVISPVGKIAIEKPLDKYTFERLKKKQFAASSITIDKKIKDEDTFTSYLFYFTVDQKKISGLLNVPKTKSNLADAEGGTYPVIVMFRGFVPKEKYTIGEGTRHSAEVFAQNGFITLAPNFLGYGKSDNPSSDSMEERFQTYTTALSLLSSSSYLNQALEKIKEVNVQADPQKIGIWGHSNGGHIALSVLAISGKNYPTVLWNPVSKSFPYSILYFTDEFDDHGKALIRVIADFEKDYDAEKYSPPNYYKWINAPIQLHQAVEDEAVPIKWSNQLVETLEKLKKEVAYFTYLGEDHNFSKGSWSTIILRSISFYKSEFEK